MVVIKGRRAGGGGGEAPRGSNTSRGGGGRAQRGRVLGGAQVGGAPPGGEGGGGGGGRGGGKKHRARRGGGARPKIGDGRGGGRGTRALGFWGAGGVLRGAGQRKGDPERVKDRSTRTAMTGRPWDLRLLAAQAPVDAPKSVVSALRCSRAGPSVNPAPSNPLRRVPWRLAQADYLASCPPTVKSPA